ncbi:hypothetical protein [Paraliomyxa miuraensis]|uniref:hypothetical protein n=1 Tax=Paraliomyxa miuraensis TaxID=376150 RepID=UPI00224E318A|nr:hypothetical protein [Paraliomyxa miuraensis]MCX4246753.1 hypothetical protein [Paraliomyxa miuraensis]
MRGVTWLVLGLGCLACNPNAGGLNNQGPPLGEPTTSTDGSTGSSTTVAADDGTSSSTSGATESPTTTAVDPTDDTTGPSKPALVDTELLARWYVDEADTDQRPEHVLDSVPPAVDLELIYTNGTPVYALDDGNRGIQWSQAGRSGRALAPIDGTKLLDELGGASEITFELVISVQAVVSNTSRFLHIGTDDDNGDFVIGAHMMNVLQVRWDDGDIVRTFDTTLTGQRQVVHVVVDTTQVAEQDRIRAYIDGDALVTPDMEAPVLGAGLPLKDTSSLVLGNRTDGQRSMRGTLLYAAIYLAVLELPDIQNNVEVLRGSDDTPM